MVKRLSYIFAIALLLGFILPLIVVNRFMTSLVTVSCSFASNSTTLGGRVDYVCYGKYNVSSSENTFVIQLVGTNVVESYLSFTDVRTPIETIFISGIMAANSSRSVLISIPSNARDVSIYGYIWGIPQDGVYPSYPSITGGNYPLVCGVGCVYNSSLIIDRPGDYLLRISSGTGGFGIKYNITGSYTLAPPLTTVTLNNKIIFNDTVGEIKIVNLSNLQRLNVINIHVDGKPNFNVLFRITVRCSVKGGDWKCVAYSRGVNESVISCTTIVKTDCELPGVSVVIPFNNEFSKYTTDARDIDVRLNGKSISIDTGRFRSITPYVIVTGLSYGDNTLDVTFTLPYIIPEAQQAIGSCIISPTAIKTYTSNFPLNTTLLIKNIGLSSINVVIKVPSEMSNLIEISPTSVVIRPQEIATVNVIIKDEVVGNISISGCAVETVNIPIEVRRQLFNIYIVIGVLIVIAVISAILLLRRRR